MNKRFVSMLTAVVLAASPMTIFAADFTDSATSKPGPVLVGPVYVFDDAIQNELDEGRIELIITPVSERYDENTLKEVQDMLVETLDKVQSTDVSQLASGLEEALEEAKKGKPDAADLTVNDLKVADIFDASLVANGVDVVHADKSVVFSVQTDLTPGDVFIVLHDYNGTISVVPATVDENGVLTITAPSLTPFIILVADDASNGAVSSTRPTQSVVNPGGTTSQPSTTPATPGTGNTVNVGAFKPTVGSSSSTSTPTKESAAPTVSDVATAANSNSMMAGMGAAAGLAGILLVLKARKGLAK